LFDVPLTFPNNFQLMFHKLMINFEVSIIIMQQINKILIQLLLYVFEYMTDYDDVNEMNKNFLLKDLMKMMMMIYENYL